MVTPDDVETLVAILTESRWLRAAGEPTERIECWIRRSLQERLPRFALTTAAALVQPPSCAGNPSTLAGHPPIAS